MKFVKYYILILCLGLLASCGYDLDEYNQNPEVSENSDPNFQLNYVQMVMLDNHHVNWHMNIGILSGISQQFAGAWETGAARAVWSGHEYSYSDWWENSWLGTYKNVIDLVERTKDGDLPNVNAAARILKVFTFARLTDAYGDIPYFKAGKAYYTDEFSSPYDLQKDIYADFFIELDQAVNALDASKDKITIDAMFNGDIDRWKRFANSLRLRLALRLVKVNAAEAEKQVKAAIAVPGGLMTSNDDNAMIKHMSIEAEDIRNNPVSEVLGRSGYSEFGVCSTFSDFLVTTNDPRLDVLLASYADNNNSNPNHVNITGYHGLAPASYGWDAPALTGTDGEERDYYGGGYLVPHKQIVDKDDPSFLLTYAETQFYMAEAVQRGWTSGSAQTYYNNGIKSAMQQLNAYGLEAEINDVQINEYLAANPYVSANGLEMINSQLWVNYFLNGHEAYSNWRRSGFPKLETPDAIDWEPQLTNEIPRRLPYIDEELDRNAQMVGEAIHRLEASGATADSKYMDGRVWWDVK